MHCPPLSGITQRPEPSCGAQEEKTKHKLKRMIQSPNSFFMDVKCPGCLQITTVYSHAQTVVLCGNCNQMLCQPTGGPLVCGLCVPQDVSRSCSAPGVFAMCAISYHTPPLLLRDRFRVPVFELPSRSRFALVS